MFAASCQHFDAILPPLPLQRRYDVAATHITTPVVSATRYCAASRRHALPPDAADDMMPRADAADITASDAQGAHDDVLPRAIMPAAYARAVTLRLI